MFKGGSQFKMYAGSIGIILLAMVVVGCSKKVAPVTGSEGIAKDGTTSSSDLSAKGGSEGGMGSSSDDAMSSRDSGSGDSGSMKSDDGMSSMGGKSADSGMSMSEAAAKFASDVYFDFDMWTIRSDAKDALSENAKWLVENKDVMVQIEGHGDERGTSEYNLALGERRARSTMRYLANLGVSPSRISFISYGEEKNICNEKTEDCFQKNRRAHFVIKK